MATVYISGPMRGYPELNFPLFRSVTERFRAAGHTVVSPVEIGERDNLTLGPNRGGASYLKADLVEVLDCDAMVLLPGWEKSVGARCEAAVGVSLGFQFYDPEGNKVLAPALIMIRGGYERPVELPVGVVGG